MNLLNKAPRIRRLLLRIRELLLHIPADEEDDWFRKGQREFMRRAFRALSINGITGDYVEFGCATGKTFGLAYQESRRFNFNCKLWAFDSFCGLPAPTSPKDVHPAWPKGAMAMSVDEFKKVCRANKIPNAEYKIVAGFYDDTIGKDDLFRREFPTDISLAYIDCDMYSSAKTVLEFLTKRLKHGMIIALDDYYCFSSTTIAGERMALLEMKGVVDRFDFLPYVQFGWAGMSFIVEDRLLTQKEARF